MYSYKIGISAQEHDDFVKKSPQVNLLQSANWAKVKDNWGNIRVGFYKEQELVATASILVRLLPLKRKLFYIPRGPIMDYLDAELVRFVLCSLKKIAKKEKALFIKFDPNLCLKRYSIGEDQADQADALRAICHLQEAGAIWLGKTRAMNETIQPRFQAKVYTREDLDKKFPKHTKRLQKDALSRGVSTSRGGEDDLEAFAAVVRLTESRKGVSLRNIEYFKKMATIYKEDLYLHLAKVHLSDRLHAYQEQLAHIEKEIKETQEHQKKRLAKLTQQKQSTMGYIKEFTHYIEHYPQEVVIAGVLSIRFGDTMEMLYAGMNDAFKKFYPQYLLYPAVFQDAYQDQIRWANMGGVEGSLDDGLTKFKSNFSPTIEEYIGEFTLAVSPFYPLFQCLYQLRKRRQKKKR